MSDTSSERKTPYNEFWRNGLTNFESEGFEYGDVIPHEWFCCAMGLTPAWVLERQGLVEAAKQAGFDYLRNIERLKDEILEQHRLFLNSVHGVGYEVIHPRDQTDIASHKFDRGVRRELAKGTKRLAFIRTEELTDADRARNRDAQAKLSFFASSVKEHRKKELAEIRKRRIGCNVYPGEGE